MVADSGEVNPGPTPGVSPHLVRLQSKDHEEILDVIDQLRSEGIGKYVDLPQIIVCGDQSSGKSSVLEAISGLNFPRKDNICTRFATELILRRAPQSGVTASIYPDDTRTPAQQERLRTFRSPTLALDQFEDIVKHAETAIGISRDGSLFSKDILRVEVSGPTQPHLTLVDLPGLYHAPDESQTVEGIEFVESLVQSYVESERSVILAVISAKSDIALQKVTSFILKVDPNGNRTMGIITKPDTLPPGSDMEQSFYELAQNKRRAFRLGWHVLKNRKYEERDFTTAQRHESEIGFLSQGIWASMPRAHIGIEALRPRLSIVLRDHILGQMAGFVAETRLALKDTESGLQKLGQSRQTITEQRQYLLYSSEKFVTLVTAAVNGIYFDSFFGDAMDKDGYIKRLRAVVQNHLTDFADAMQARGEQRRVLDGENDAEEAMAYVTRADFVEEVRWRLRRTRGRELPGTFNPLIVSDLFFLHSQPWKTIVSEYMELLLRDVRETVILILRAVLDSQSIEGLLKHFINPRLTELEDGVRAKAAELLKPQQMGHPITYNHYFVETIRAIRQQHLYESITKKLKDFFYDEYPVNPSDRTKHVFSMNALIEALGSQPDTDMEEFACSEAIDCMLAYYKVRTKTFSRSAHAKFRVPIRLQGRGLSMISVS